MGASWGVSGRLWVSRKCLGASWGRLVPSCTQLGPSWSHLGSFNQKYNVFNIRFTYWSISLLGRLNPSCVVLASSVRLPGALGRLYNFFCRFQCVLPRLGAVWVHLGGLSNQAWHVLGASRGRLGPQKQPKRSKTTLDGS